MVSVGIPIRVFEGLGGFAVDNEVSVGISVKSAYDVEKGGFTASRLTEYGDEFAFAEFDVHASERFNGGIACNIMLRYVFKLKQLSFLRKNKKLQHPKFYHSNVNLI